MSSTSINIKNILVTGADGQVGRELQLLASHYPKFKFIFTNRSQLDITDESKVVDFFHDNKNIELVINCAAYTAVDKAESEPEKASAVNVTGAQNLAKLSGGQGIPFIHISTDFVFDGKGQEPYNEESAPNPLGVYGQTKLDGEKRALANNPQTLIVRTSWVYSSFGNNFVKTMLRLGKEKPQLKVVNDQTGSPTYARDLAQVLLTVAEKIDRVKEFGIFHFSNSGSITWYEFAQTILELKKIMTPVYPISTEEFPTPAKRPAYSVLNKEKIQSIYGIELRAWKQSLEECLQKL